VKGLKIVKQNTLQREPKQWAGLNVTGKEQLQIIKSLSVNKNFTDDEKR
jgi:hypothetical protein